MQFDWDWDDDYWGAPWEWSDDTMWGNYFDDDGWLDSYFDELEFDVPHGSPTGGEIQSYGAACLDDAEQPFKRVATECLRDCAYGADGTLDDDWADDEMMFLWLDDDGLNQWNFCLPRCATEQPEFGRECSLPTAVGAECSAALGAITNAAVEHLITECHGAFPWVYDVSG
jgi:hypothetical protein